MIRVWLLLFFCILIAHYYEKNMIIEDGKIENRVETNISATCFIVLITVLVLFSGLRTVMNDTLNYTRVFLNDAMVPKGWSSVFNVDWLIGSNPLFNIYLRCIKTIFGSNSQVFLFLTSLLIEYSYLKFLRKYTLNFEWSIFTFIAFTIFAFSMSAMKQAISIAIGIWAIPGFLENKYLKAVIILLIASLFHPYVIILGALPLFSRDVWKSKTLIIIFATILVLFTFDYFVNIVMRISDAFGEVNEIEAFTEQGVGIARILSYLYLPAVTFIARNEINEMHNPFVNVCVNATVLSGCIMLISGFGGSYMFGRVPSYLDLFTCITVAVVFCACQYRGREFYKLVFVCLLLVFYYVYYEKYLIGYCNGDWFADIYKHVSVFELFGGRVW